MKIGRCWKINGMLPWLAIALGSATLVEGATTLNPDGEWNRFRWFGAAGSFGSLEGPFDFSVPSGSIGILDVTDAFEIGDKFLVSDGTSVLPSTLDPIPGTDFTRDPDLAFADAQWSSGTYLFSPGDHSIDFETIVPENGPILGGAFLRLSFDTLPSISWNTPGFITYGDPLTTSQLNATPPGGTDGILVYDPPLGTVLDAAASQSITVTFVPNNAVYSEIAAAVQIEVRRAPLTITADSKERPVGTSNPTLTAKYAGLVNGDSPSSLDTPATITTSATIASSPGEYPIAIDSAEDSNYSITFVPGILTVSGQQTLELSWVKPSPITYGQALGSAQLSATIPGNVPGTFSYSPLAGTVLSAGLNQSLSVVFTPTDSARYSSAAKSVAIDVLPAPLAITANDQVRTLGNPNPTLSVHVSGFVNGDTLASLDSPVVVTTTANSSSPAGIYPIIPRGATSANYTIQFFGGTLEVTDKLIPQIAWEDPAPIIYGTPLSNKQLNANVSAVSGVFTYTAPVGSVLGAGSHQLTVEFVPSDPDYRSAMRSVSLTVQPAALSIRADDATRSPGFANPTLTATYTGFVNNDTVSQLDSPAILTTTAAIDSPSGAYPIVVSGASDTNYAIIFHNGTLTITNKPTADLAWSTPAPITYGEPLTEAQLSASADSNVAGTLVFSPPLGTVLDAGLRTLRVTFTPNDPARYETSSITVSLQVNPAHLTIRADDQTGILASSIAGVDFVTVGDPNNPPRFHDDGFGDQLPFGAVDKVFEIGKHEITNALYTTFLNAVAKADPNELFHHSMEDEARGGIIRHGTTPHFSYETKPLMGNKPVMYVNFWDACRFCNWFHHGKPEGPQNAFTTENGAYDLTDASKVRNNTALRNSAARFYLPSEDQWYKAAYYDPNKEGGYWIYGTRNDSIPDQALANMLGDIINQTDNVANWGRASDWDSNQNGIIENEIVSDNIGPEDGNVTSVGSGGPGSESYYGAADMSGNVGEWTDTPLGSFGRLQRGGTWNVPHPLLTSDYRVPTITTEEIRELGFRIARDPVEGDEWILPPLTVSYEGFVNGDTPANLDFQVLVTTDATASSPAGVYAITPQGASSSNYIITFEPGTLTVDERLTPLLTWALPSSIQYGTELSNLQLNARATLENDGIIEGSFTYAPPLGAILDSGEHELTVAFEPTDTQVYKAATATTTLDVTPAPLAIRAPDVTRIQGTPNPSFSASYEGFVNGDTEFDLATPVSFLTDANIDSPPGSYAIIVADAVGTNYTIAFQPGTLTVVPSEPLAFPVLEFDLRSEANQLWFQWQQTQGVELFVSDDLLTWRALTEDETPIVENGTVSVVFSVLGLYNRYFRLQRVANNP